MMDPGRLDQVLGAWLQPRAVQVSGRLVIAIDGKAVRGAKDRDGKARTWSRRWRTASALMNDFAVSLGMAQMTPVLARSTAASWPARRSVIAVPGTYHRARASGPMKGSGPR